MLDSKDSRKHSRKLHAPAKILSDKGGLKIFNKRHIKEQLQNWYSSRTQFPNSSYHISKRGLLEQCSIS